MYGDYVERYLKPEVILCSVMESDGNWYLDLAENVHIYNSCCNQAFNKSININNNEKENVFYSSKIYEQLPAVCENMLSEYNNVNIRKNSFINSENAYGTCEYINKDYENIYSQYKLYNNTYKELNELYETGGDNQYYDYINTSDIRDSVSNSFSDLTKNISISLGGITQNFSGSENAEDIAQGLCIYLKNALNNCAEGVYL